MRHTTVDVSAAKPEERSLELTKGLLIRVRADRFMTRLKVFERLIKNTTTATDCKVCEWYYAYPFSEEPEPEYREQRVLETRSWHDPSRGSAMDISTAKHEQGSLETTEDIVRVRAYRFYEERGCEDGHDLDDWLRAEAEITGKKLAAA